MGNIAERLRTSVEDTPQQPVIVTPDGEQILYREFWIKCSEFAGGLRNHDIGTGDRVGLTLDFSTEMLISLYGALRNGSVVVALPSDKDPEPIMEKADVEGVVGSTDRLEDDLPPTVTTGFRVGYGGELDLGIGFDTFTQTTGLHGFWEIIGRSDDDPAIVTYEGTEPVGIPLTHQNLSAALDTVIQTVPGGVSTDDTMLMTVPSGGVGTITSGANLGVFSGATIVPGAEPDDVNEEALTMAVVSPSVLDVLESFTTGSLRTVGVDGPVPDENRIAIVDSLTQRGGYQITGVPEACSISHGTEAVGESKPGSVGEPLPGIRALVEVTQTEPGETPDQSAISNLLITGEHVISGYEEEPASDRGVVDRGGDQWVDTGQLAYMDMDDNQYFVSQ